MITTKSRRGPSYDEQAPQDRYSDQYGSQNYHYDQRDDEDAYHGPRYREYENDDYERPQDRHSNYDQQNYNEDYRSQHPYNEYADYDDREEDYNEEYDRND